MVIVDERNVVVPSLQFATTILPHANGELAKWQSIESRVERSYLLASGYGFVGILGPGDDGAGVLETIGTVGIPALVHPVP